MLNMKARDYLNFARVNYEKNTSDKRYFFS